MLKHRADGAQTKVERKLVGRAVRGDDDKVMDVSDSVRRQTYTPRYELLYCPLIPRLKYLLAHPVFSHLFIHGDENQKKWKPGEPVNDIHQAHLWKRFASLFPLTTPDAEPDTRAHEYSQGKCDVHVAFGLSADRASLSKQKMNNNYACLPILLNIINWPIWIRNREEFLLLCALPPIHEKDPKLAISNKRHQSILALCFDFSSTPHLSFSLPYFLHIFFSLTLSLFLSLLLSRSLPFSLSLSVCVTW